MIIHSQQDRVLIVHEIQRCCISKHRADVTQGDLYGIRLRRTSACAMCISLAPRIPSPSDYHLTSRGLQLRDILMPVDIASCDND
jgi:hypothetical protein